MIDRDNKLISDAAEAAGIDGRWVPGFEDLGLCISESGHPIKQWWNPLKNDADAFALGIHMGITLEVDYQTKTANAKWINPHGNPAKCPDYLSMYFGDNDPYDDCRRVITRAAQEISSQEKRLGK